MTARRRLPRRHLLDGPRLGRAWGRPSSGTTRLGLAWYTEQEWRRLKELAHDREALDDSYEEWLRTAEETLEKLRSRGVVVEKVALRVADAAEWCARERRPVTSAERAAYAGELLRKQPLKQQGRRTRG